MFPTRGGWTCARMWLPWGESPAPPSGAPSIDRHACASPPQPHLRHASSPLVGTHARLGSGAADAPRPCVAAAYMR
eukprot:365067-Chlamydomonas_euryale.AAC.24